jgi:hypothetical protein
MKEKRVSWPSGERPRPFRSNTPEVTLSGFAGGEFLPLRRSEGGAFPFLLILDGVPTSPSSRSGTKVY